MSEAIGLEQGVKVAQPVAAGRSLQAMAWQQLWRKRTALVGMGIIVVLVLTAILADVLTPYEPTATGSGVPWNRSAWPTVPHPRRIAEQLCWVNDTGYPFYQARTSKVKGYPFYNQAYLFLETTWLDK